VTIAGKVLPSLRCTTNSPDQLLPALSSDMISSARSSIYSDGVTATIGRPITSTLDQP
jgi:hypothetical protein